MFSIIQQMTSCIQIANDMLSLLVFRIQLEIFHSNHEFCYVWSLGFHIKWNRNRFQLSKHRQTQCIRSQVRRSAQPALDLDQMHSIYNCNQGDLSAKFVQLLEVRSMELDAMQVYFATPANETKQFTTIFSTGLSLKRTIYDLIDSKLIGKKKLWGIKQKLHQCLCSFFLEFAIFHYRLIGYFNESMNLDD